MSVNLDKLRDLLKQQPVTCAVCPEGSPAPELVDLFFKETTLIAEWRCHGENLYYGFAARPEDEANIHHVLPLELAPRWMFNPPLDPTTLKEIGPSPHRCIETCRNPILYQADALPRGLHLGVKVTDGRRIVGIDYKRAIVTLAEPIPTPETVDCDKVCEGDFAEYRRLVEQGRWNDCGPAWELAVGTCLSWLAWRAPEWTRGRRIEAAVSLSGLVMNGGRAEYEKAAAIKAEAEKAAVSS